MPAQVPFGVNPASLQLVETLIADGHLGALAAGAKLHHVAATAATARDIRTDIAVVSLPVASQKNNALFVNALQRCFDIVGQNSLQEGFGLTTVEAMWKRTAVVGSAATGLRQRIRPGLEGCLIRDPEDAEEIARVLGGLLGDPLRRQMLGRRTQQLVYDEFLLLQAGPALD